MICMLRVFQDLFQWDKSYNCVSTDIILFTLHNNSEKYILFLFPRWEVFYILEVLKIGW